MWVYELVYWCSSWLTRTFCWLSYSRSLIGTYSKQPKIMTSNICWCFQQGGYELNRPWRNYPYLNEFERRTLTIKHENNWIHSPTKTSQTEWIFQHLWAHLHFQVQTSPFSVVSSPVLEHQQHIERKKKVNFSKQDGTHA